MAKIEKQQKDAPPKIIKRSRLTSGKRRKTTDGINRDIFVNCPFDSEYDPFFRAVVFTIIRCGFRVRCALETDDSGKSRFLKICDMIDQSAFGFHDISRVELDDINHLPRFNMPLELGVFLGAARKDSKSCVIFDDVKFRYQKFISDISGQDIKYHECKPEKLVAELANWLRLQVAVKSSVPGGQHVCQEFKTFLKAYPSICRTRKIKKTDVKFKDLEEIVIEYIESTQAKSRFNLRNRPSTKQSVANTPSRRGLRGAVKRRSPA